MLEENIKMYREERFVANFDILGMRELIRTKENRAIAMLYDFHDIIINHVGKLAIKIIKTNEIIIDRIEHILFSDTIILFTKGNSESDLYAIVTLCNELFGQALHRCIPLRGGIAFGNLFYHSNTKIICGKPLIEAYEFGESAKWLGIIATEEIAKKSHDENIQTKNKQPCIISWDVPSKDGTAKRNVINWPSVFAKNFLASIPITVAQFYEGFENDFGDFESLPNNIKEKYENTVAFVNTCLGRNNN